MLGFDLMIYFGPKYFGPLSLFPLLGIEKPKHACFILVDSVDETYHGSSNSHLTTTTSSSSSSAASSILNSSGRSKAISELLGKYPS